MINVDDRLLTSGITADQLYLLLHISKYVGEKMACFPSNATLSLATGWSVSKLNDIKKSLIVDGYIKRHERFVDERQISNLYTVETPYISVFVNLKGKGGEENTPYRNPGTPLTDLSNPDTGNPATEVLTSEVLNSSSTADQNFEKWAKDVFADYRTVDAFCISRKLPKAKYDAYKDQFIAEARSKTDEYKRRVDVLNHFLNYSSRLFDIEKDQAARAAKNPAPPADPTKNLKRFV